VRVSLEEILIVATPDVAAAARWLVSEGADVVWEDRPHGMAFAGLEFVLGNTSVRMVRDRGQWMMDLRRGQEPWLDLDLLRLARQGSKVYPALVRQSEGQPPSQLPEGVSWSDELPDLLDWLHSTQDAAQRCASLSSSRASRLFPSKRRSSLPLGARCSALWLALAP
jgi:hypothetical protein